MTLADTALYIERARLGRYVNIGAELYQKLAIDRKAAAQFYTTPITAELLAGLTIRESDMGSEEWGDADMMRRHVLVDMTCGTGTLLRAGYGRIQSFHERNGGTAESLLDLHRGAIEAGIRGTDIFPIATHLTTSSLEMMGWGEKHEDTNIGWLAVGTLSSTHVHTQKKKRKMSDSWKTGALEYTATDAITDLFGDTFGRESGTGTDAKGHSVEIRNGSARWILMNPPYSRTRGGSSAFNIDGLSADEKAKCQKKWAILIKDAPVNKIAGMASSFLYIACRKVRPGGRIGFVLPLTAAAADKWSGIRQYIELNFKDIIAVAAAGGHRDMRLSHDTHMNEMLLVAERKTGGGGARSPIKCVTLKKPLRHITESLETVRAILESSGRVSEETPYVPVRVGNEEMGHVAVMDAGGDGGPWHMLGVSHVDLGRTAGKLCSGGLRLMNGQSMQITVGMATIGDVFAVGAYP